MSEDITRGLPRRSFEERVLSELSGIRQGLTGLDTRLTSLEDKVDARLRETRPIWEGVLARLTAIESELPRLGGIEKEMARMNRQFRSFVADIFQVRARVEQLEEENDKRTV
jgi:predicted nuclease with TOPRIM domain